MRITRRQLRRIIREATDVSRSRLFHPEKNPRLQLPRNVVEQEITRVIKAFQAGEYKWGPWAQAEFKNMSLAGAGSDGWRFEGFPNWENGDFQTVIDAMNNIQEAGDIGKPETGEESSRGGRFSGPFHKFKVGDPVTHIKKPEQYGLGLVVQCKWGGRNICVKWKNVPELQRHYPYILELNQEFQGDRRMMAAMKRKAAQYEDWAEMAG